MVCSPKSLVSATVCSSRETLKHRSEINISIGITGNALALEDKDFEHFLTYTTGHEMKSMEKDGMLEKSSCPESLFGGEAGRAWSWAVADKGLENASWDTTIFEVGDTATLGEYI